MTRAVIALGSNLGERADFLDAAVAALAEIDGLRVVAVSPWYESVAHTLDGPDPSKPRYLNGVALVDAELSAVDTLHALHTLEAQLGRPTEHAKWADRTLDLDLIVFGEDQSATEQLTLPHPRAHERVFVLQPWLDLDPAAHIPGFGPVAELLTATPATERAALTQLAGAE